MSGGRSGRCKRLALAIVVRFDVLPPLKTKKEKKMNRVLREKLLVTYGYLKARGDLPFNVTDPLEELLFPQEKKASTIEAPLPLKNETKLAPPPAML